MILLKGILHKDICFNCKIKFSDNEKMFNIMYLDEDDNIDKFIILCEKCFTLAHKDKNTIWWQTMFKKPFSRRNFINNLKEYFLSNYEKIVEEKSRFIIAYLLYQQHILQIKEQTEESIIFQTKEGGKTFKIQNFYGRISPRFVKNILKDIWKTLNGSVLKQQ